MKTKKTCHRTAALLSMLLLPACAAGGGDAIDDTANGAEPAAGGVGVSPTGQGHMMPMPDERAPRAKQLTAPQGQQPYNFTYHGGALISNVKVVTVFWTAGVVGQSSLNQFYGAIVQSPYVDWLSEYNGGQQSIGRGSFVTSFVDPGAPAGGQITDQAIQQELARLLGNGSLPAADANTLYMVHFPPGVSITMQNATSCQQFCAYHSSFQDGSSAVYYGVMPDMGGACARCGGATDPISSTTVVASHEVVESITDPGIGLANQSQDESLLGWYDDNGGPEGEIADVCQGYNDTVAGWAVQQVYSMQAGACITTKSSSSGGGAVPGCTHGVCQKGAPLTASCGPCTAQVCQADAHCCATAWDAACVQDAATICGKPCL